MILPDSFRERMTKILGDGADAFFCEFDCPPVRAFRVNEIKISTERFEEISPVIDRKKAAFPPVAYYTEEQFPGSLPCHHAGMIYMQDPSAMVTVYATEIDAGMKVLDSCSAPGGKTTQLAAFVGDEGIVVANEYDTKRCRILQSNVERMGCRNTVVTNLDTAVLAETYPEIFDIVLADAPCSGEGMFRKNELAVGEWSEENVFMCAERQKEILTNVQKCVKNGGRLIYSTCTFSLEENEMNVEWFLESFPEFELCDVMSGLKEMTSEGVSFDGCRHDMSKTRRFYPHVSHGEGQFIAVFERKASSLGHVCAHNRKNKKKDKDKSADKSCDIIALAKEFLRENLEGDIDGEIIALGGYAYLKPDIDIPRHSVFAAGVCIGELVGKRLVPHHQLFSAFGERFKRKIQLESRDEDVLNYLKGLEIKVDKKLFWVDKPDGWAAVLVDGCAMGGGKISGEICKNHYPKGLRNKQ